VEHDGSVFPCDFYVEPERRLGNLHDQDLATLFSSPGQQAFGQAKADLGPTCRACPWLKHCHGGCPKDRIRDPRDRGHFHFCKAHTRFFEYADPFLRDLGDRWKAIHRPNAR